MAKTPTPIFEAKIQNGIPTIEDTERFLAYAKTFGEGAGVQVIVRKPVKYRSTEQNNYYWGVVIGMIGEHNGYRTPDELEEIHETLKTMFLRRPGFAGKERVRGTSSLSTVEFEEYLDMIRQWAMIRYDLYIPLPNEVAIPEYERYED